MIQLVQLIGSKTSNLLWIGMVVAHDGAASVEFLRLFLEITDMEVALGAAFKK